MERGLDLFFRPRKSELEEELVPMGVRSTALPDGEVIKYPKGDYLNSLQTSEEIVKSYQKVKQYNQI